MEVTVISRETIKPSSPTPEHLRHLKFSLLDQHAFPPTLFTHVLIFYSAQGDVHRNMSDRLKRSLSDVLTEFYPVAGKLADDQLWVDCNDQGCEYVEARVKPPLTLSQLLSSPQPEELNRLFPHGIPIGKLSAVQVTIFDGCGGMVIGVRISHVIADASSLAMFINSWATTARGVTRTVHPKIGFASFFPPMDVPIPTVPVHRDDGKALKLVTKRFVFPQLKIDELKANFKYQSPTRVEALFALVFKRLIHDAKSRSSKSIATCTGMNLRSRMRPPMPHYFGNVALPRVMEHTGSESLNNLGVQFNNLIKEINADSLEKLLADNAFLLSENLKQLRKLLENDIRVFGITSWCRFPINEADFGWGVPKWTAAFYPDIQDEILLLDAKNGDGIEVWATLEEEDMARFESDKEILHYACVNPKVDKM